MFLALLAGSRSIGAQIAQIFSVLVMPEPAGGTKTGRAQARDPSGGSCSVPALVAKRR